MDTSGIDINLFQKSIFKHTLPSNILSNNSEIGNRKQLIRFDYCFSGIAGGGGGGSCSTTSCEDFLTF